MCFYFRTRGVREFLLLAVEFSSQNLPGYLHAIFMPVKKWNVVDSWWLFRYVKIYQSWWFSYRLAFGFGTHTCRLALDFWNLQHWILEFATSICNWRGGGTRGLAVYFALNFCSFSLFHSVCLVCDQKIVLYCSVFGIQKIVLCNCDLCCLYTT